MKKYTAKNQILKKVQFCKIRYVTHLLIKKKMRDEMAAKSAEFEAIIEGLRVDLSQKEFEIQRLNRLLEQEKQRND